MRIELVPDGDEALTKTVAELVIANDGAGNVFTGSYTAVLREFSVRPLGRPEVHEMQTVISDVERDLVRPAQLVGIALSVLAPVKRTMSSVTAVHSGQIVLTPRQK